MILMYSVGFTEVFVKITKLNKLNYNIKTLSNKLNKPGLRQQEYEFTEQTSGDGLPLARKFKRLQKLKLPLQTKHSRYTPTFFAILPSNPLETCRVLLVMNEPLGRESAMFIM